jgi:hypothetical protein
MVDDSKRSRSPSSRREWNENARCAHDMRTHLTVIKVRAQLIRRRLRSGKAEIADLDRSLDQIDAAIARLEQEIH